MHLGISDASGDSDLGGAMSQLAAIIADADEN